MLSTVIAVVRQIWSSSAKNYDNLKEHTGGNFAFPTLQLRLEDFSSSVHWQTNQDFLKMFFN